METIVTIAFAPYQLVGPAKIIEERIVCTLSSVEWRAWKLQASVASDSWFEVLVSIYSPLQARTN
jgi:hypothetical protein